METLTQCPVCGEQQFSTFIDCRDHLLTGEQFRIVACNSCGFRFTNPRPDAADLGRYYQSSDYISHSNSRKGLFNRAYQLIRTYTIRRKRALISSFSEKGSLLDIGSATGEFLSFMKKSGWKVTGIEPDEKTRKFAISEYGLEVLDESGLAGLKDGSFDVITLWHVLEHVPDLPGRMQEIHRLLKPGGYVFIAVPNSHAWDAEKYGKFWAAYDVPRHLYHFTKDTLKRLVRNSGLLWEDIYPMKFDAFYVSMLSEKNRTGKMNWLGGFWNGFRSNLAAKEQNNYSSLITVSKKDKN